jgi:hypothetical protein
MSWLLNIACDILVRPKRKKKAQGSPSESTKGVWESSKTYSLSIEREKNNYYLVFEGSYLREILSYLIDEYSFNKISQRFLDDNYPSATWSRGYSIQREVTEQLIHAGYTVTEYKDLLRRRNFQKQRVLDALSRGEAFLCEQEEMSIMLSKLEQQLQAAKGDLLKWVDPWLRETKLRLQLTSPEDELLDLYLKVEEIVKIAREKEYRDWQKDQEQKAIAIEEERLERVREERIKKLLPKVGVYT